MEVSWHLEFKNGSDHEVVASYSVIIMRKVKSSISNADDHFPHSKKHINFNDIHY